MKRQTKAEREHEQALLNQRKQLVDEYGRLDAQLSPLKSKIRRFEEIGKIIRSWHVDADPELSVTSVGSEYEVVLGPCGNQTHMADAASIYAALGRETFLRCANVTLKALEQHANPATIATLTRKERTGPRSIIARRVLERAA